MPFDRPLAIVDLETTGGHISRDRVTEVGLILIDGEHVERYEVLLNPGRPIPPFIAEMTGIDDAMVADAPPFAAVADALLARLQGRLFIAHNVRFDYGFLKNEFKRLGLRFRAEVLCTVKLSRKLYPQHYKHNLDSIIARHGIVLAARHRALADAEALYQFLQSSAAQLGADALAAAASELLHQPQLPPQLAPELLDELPDVAGVYTLYGADELALYVGRSDNLRSGVLGHFPGFAPARKPLFDAEVQHIAWQETVGEFGAALTELRLTRELLPLHNPRARQPQALYAILLQSGGSGFLLPRIEALGAAPPAALDSCYGLFRNQKEAKKALLELCSGAGLCLTCLQLEARGARPGACLAYRGGRCKGACIGKEDADSHNIRLLHALARLRLASWPYPGRLAVRETDAVSGRWQQYLFDNWCYLGTEDSDGQAQAAAARFDAEVYKLLRGVLKKVPEGVTLLPLVS